MPPTLSVGCPQAVGGRLDLVRKGVWTFNDAGHLRRHVGLVHVYDVVTVLIDVVGGSATSLSVVMWRPKTAPMGQLLGIFVLLRYVR